MDRDTRRTGTFRAWPEAGDFRNQLPERPSLIEILAALKKAWDLEPTMFGARVGVEMRAEDKDRIRTRQVRYGDPQLEVSPMTGEAKWVIECEWEDAYHMGEFGHSKEDLESIQIGETVQTPLRGIPVPPFHKSGANETETWWGYEGDIDVLRNAVTQMRQANSAIIEILQLEVEDD